METNADAERSLREQANRLYWESDESVNQVADSLDLSKGTLYNLVQPLPTGVSCPRCGEEMEYPNRTARDKQFVTCPACDLEEDEDTARAEGATVRPRAIAWMAEELGTNRVVLGSAFLGAAAGLALALWARKR